MNVDVTGRLKPFVSSAMASACTARISPTTMFHQRRRRNCAASVRSSVIPGSFRGLPEPWLAGLPSAYVASDPHSGMRRSEG